MICPNCTSDKHDRCCARCGKVHRANRTEHEFCSVRCGREQAKEDALSSADETGIARGAGRPRSEHAIRYQLRLHAEQLAAYKTAAQSEDRDLQNWIRRTLDAAARKAERDR